MSHSGMTRGRVLPPFRATTVSLLRLSATTRNSSHSHLAGEWGVLGSSPPPTCRPAPSGPSIVDNDTTCSRFGAHYNNQHSLHSRTGFCALAAGQQLQQQALTTAAVLTGTWGALAAPLTAVNRPSPCMHQWHLTWTSGKCTSGRTFRISDSLLPAVD